MSHSQKNFIRNLEISEMFKVSATSVVNWVEAAVEGKNELVVDKFGKKYKILDTPHNRALLENFSKKANLYRNKNQKATITPSKDFFEAFSFEKIIEIIHFLEVKKQIPIKYSTFGKGSSIWEKSSEVYSKPNRQYLLPESTQLLNGLGALLAPDFKNNSSAKNLNLFILYPKIWKNTEAFLASLGNYKEKIKKINIVDSSPLLGENFVTKIKEKYPSAEVKFYQKDLESESIASVFFDNKRNEETTNLVFLDFNNLNYFSNLDLAFGNLQNSIRSKDYLILVNEVDNSLNQGNFNFVEDPKPYTWILQEMGVAVEDCKILNRYESQINEKVSSLVLDKDYTFEIKNDQINYTFKIKSDTEILLCSQKLFSKVNLLSRLSNLGLNFTKTVSSKSGYNLLIVGNKSES